jgi:hypothetical protein
MLVYVCVHVMTCVKGKIVLSLFDRLDKSVAKHSRLS